MSIDKNHPAVVEALQWRSDNCLCFTAAAERKHDAQARHILTRILNAIEKDHWEACVRELDAAGDRGTKPSAPVAAPELLHVVQWVRDCESLRRENGEKGLHDDLLSAIDAAIAKAERRE